MLCDIQVAIEKKCDTLREAISYIRRHRLRDDVHEAALFWAEEYFHDLESRKKEKNKKA